MRAELDDFDDSERDRLSRLIGDAPLQRVGKRERDEQQDDVHGRELSYRLAAMNWLGDWANLLLRWTHFIAGRSEEHTSELQSQSNLVFRLLLEKKKWHW